MSAVTHSEIAGTAEQRASGAGRRFGYLVAIAINLVLLYLINVAPGWQAVSWLTAQAGDLVWFANLCLGLGIALNGLYILADPVWFKALGEAISTAFAAVLVGRLLQVYPFDFAGWSVDWSPLVTILLVVALVGTVVAVIVNIVRFGMAVARR